MTRSPTTLALFLGLALAGCQGEPGGDSAAPGEAAEASGDAVAAPSTSGPGDAEDRRPYAGIGEQEVLRFTGTEPFWGGQVTAGTLTYSTPENIDGTQIAVERFAGRNGLSFSGTLDGANFVMAVTPGECSDGMSDRTYPFTVTLQVGAEQRQGCAWTEAQSFTGSEHP
jgi:uncharacterized membrane protein